MVLSQSAVEVFCSYAHEDEAYRQQLEAHLSVLKRQGLISLWHDRQILPGAKWNMSIDAHLERASIILLLISADFIASDDCSNETRRALERYEAGKTQVIPIVVRPCYWDQLPIASFQPLPLNAKPISLWASTDEAWAQVTADLQRIIEVLSIPSASISSKEILSSTSVDPVVVSISLPSDTIDVLITKVGSAIAKSILKLWLKDNTLAENLSSPLIKILESKTSDIIAQHNGRRQFEAIGERVAESLFPIFEGEGASLNESHYTAVALAVAETLNISELSSRLLVEHNLDPSNVANHLITISSAITQSFSVTEIELYERVIKESCQYIVDIVSQLPTFTEHTLSEILKREELLIARSNQILTEVQRMRSHIDSKAGSANFELEYRRGVVRNLDMLELFGFDTSTANRRYCLSTAYITLAVEMNIFNSKESCDTRTGSHSKSNSDQEKSSKIVSVDEVLANARRLLLCGSPGSGKTTLLTWIAVNAASKGFKKSLSYWNEYLPFYIRLRQFVNSVLPQPSAFPALVTPAIAETIPKDWVHTTLASGHALVLIDGLDELPASQRKDVQTWLKDLIGTYPKALFIVTSRPHAVEERWMDRDGFKEAELQPMNTSDIKAFIHHWHVAIREELSSEEEKTKLDILEGRLRQEMEQNPPKLSLATNPLLCAMLCALNRDRRQQLPSDRLELYEACCYMLLERLDKERHIDLIDYPALNYRQKRLLLEDLAYWMVRNGSSEVEQQFVNSRFTQKLLGMQESFSKDSIPDLGTRVCKFFVERSGLIREPIVGQIDFMHRTFQEFLAAKASVDEMDTGLLIANAHNDQWREVIILACGFAGKSMRERLLQDLINRGNKEKQFRYSLHLLAVSCLETSIELKQQIKTQVKKLLDELVPPRDRESARSLASARDLVVPFLATNSSYDAQTASVCVYTLGLIASPAALNMIEGYAQDTRAPVVEELFKASQSFDKALYTKRVLSRMLQKMVPNFPPDKRSDRSYHTQYES